MFSKIKSVAISGLEAIVVRVETDAGDGLPEFIMSGYLSSQVVDAKERIRVAIKNSGITLRPQKVLVNISPADIKKAGTGFDLPIAVGLLEANGIVDHKRFDECIVMGELSLDGKINAVRGIILSAIAAKESNIKRIVIPYDNLKEASIIEGVEIVAVRHLEEVIEYGLGEDSYIVRDKENVRKKTEAKKDYSDIAGQIHAKRATMVAVAGMHNIMYVGPPGSGKTMLAQRISSIMPELGFDESIELTKIYSVAGKLKDNGGLIEVRPFRAPHHTVTSAAMLGGGNILKPGEITLANSGVLFLDEITEYKTSLLESLRQPLEDKKIRLVRMSKEYEFPCNFMLAAAMNPCKCGYYPDRSRCGCSESDIMRYIGRISQPMWDRFDICVSVSKVSYDELSGKNTGKDSEMNSSYMSACVEKAYEIQKQRFQGTDKSFNSQMDVNDVHKYCCLREKERKMMEKAYERFNMTARGYNKVLKTARTIADIEGSENIEVRHLSEAFSYRSIRGK